MNKLAFVFPGQGSQAVGMGYDFFSQVPEVKTIFAKTDNKLGFAL